MRLGFYDPRAKAGKPRQRRFHPRSEGSMHFSSKSIKRRYLQLHLILSIAAVVLSTIKASAEILKVVVNDTIQPISAEYIARGIDEAQHRKPHPGLIENNPPGGLVGSTREIIQHITASSVPVIIYVTPSGSRAASAGFFILESADIAAMAPGTTTGAAHPVIIGGGKVDDVMKEKMENDAAALMRSVVARRGHNVEVAKVRGRQ